MGQELRGREALAKIKDLIADIDIGMLTTVGEDGLPRSRPMSTNKDVSEDGTIWMFSRKDSLKIEHIEAEPVVQISFCNPSKNTYISVTGSAEVITNKAIIEKHWKPALKAWFPKGPQEDSDIALLKINLKIAEYWESTGNFVSHTLSFAKALLTSEEIKDLGDHGLVQRH